MPLVGASGAAKVPKEGLLKEALAAFAREGRTGIEAFIEFLADLPAEVSRQTKAQRYGVEMADQLRGKIAVNPLLSAPGQPLDPAVLFAASRPGATRVSVVNFSGLEAEASRQDFVNQLQMALFTFIKRHPSERPRLYVCDEAQNFAPSGASTASKASAIALARQGRKFGLGMIFATQGPKGIDTNIVSNCVTHFYGRMSSPALIDATEEMMAAKGRAAKDLGALGAGTFYFATEGSSAPVKLKTPLCLSLHTKPATPEEVVALARG
ncbi:MAG: ATP-binding protein [Caulobacteraceae bacterium]|nr:ATP-binding protein [Caulobacter sp.]